MNIWIDPDFRRHFPAERLRSDMASMQGEVFRRGEGRVTLRFEREGEYFFLKRHTGVGWKEIFKDLLQGRLPILGAYNEWCAIERIQILNVATLHPIAFARQGWNPARQQSFLVTQELANTTSLEDVLKDWQERPDFVALKRTLIKAAADIARRLHRNGLNHRDFYVCHLHVSNDWLANPQGKAEIFVIDLHRAQIRRSVPRRWLVKDIGSLYFSAMDAGLTKTDQYRFLREYTGESLHEALRSNRGFWQQVQRRADRLYATRPELRPESIDLEIE